ncbi:TIGR02391 family protein [Streptomyces sp. CC210A]|uniref:TIGR02391 family protein n=1 Tax=Streptomyces sp. CC210A TaxID=2898184 RepID=UPI001F3737A6|nr:TIGR02391 family protein [Streptomyces sp. CC210A]
MATYGADYLKRLLAAVERFEEVFGRWMETQSESDHVQSRGLLPTVWPKDGQDQATIRRLELDVAEAAGAAARAVAVTGAQIAVAGIGVLDPIENWSLMSAPKALFTPQEVRTTAARVRGRLSMMIDEAEAASESATPGFAPSELHEVIWTAAAAHWTTHQYRVAVREASEALTVHWKERLGRNDVSDTSFWQQTLSGGEPEIGKPKLAWPGPAEDQTVKSMRGGLAPLAGALNNLATGLNLTVRNVATHTRGELTEQEGMERLAAYSYFARLLDQCEIRHAEEPEGT